MNKCYTCLFAASLFAVATFAQGFRSVNTTGAVLNGNDAFGKAGSHIQINRSDRLALSYDERTSAISSSASKAATADELITEQPAGKLYKNMYRVAAGYIKLGNLGYYLEHNQGYASDVVIADDGSFYIKNPFSTFLTKSWLKGHKAVGDTIEFDFPQFIYQDTEDGITSNYYAQRMRRKKSQNGDSSGDTYVIDEESKTIKFTWRNDTLRMVDGEMLGLTDAAGKWIGRGDRSIEMFINDDKTVSPKNPAAATSYIMKYPIVRFPTPVTGTDARAVKVVIEGNDIYLGDLYDDVPNCWVKGTLENGKAVFKKQFAGMDTTSIAYSYFWPAHADSVQTPLMEWYVSYSLSDKTIFDYDEATRTLKTDSAFIFNVGRSEEYVYALAGFTKAELMPWENKPFTPVAPKIVEFEPYDNDLGYGYVLFDLPAESATGDDILPGQLYYQIYLNDQPLTLTPDEYINVPKDMTEIPYSFSDDYDITMDGTERNVSFFRTDFSRLGVQSIYKGGGETRRSDIVYATTTGINGVSGDASKVVKGIVYTDLSGRRVANPAKGIYIKTTTYADGNVRNVKIVKR